MKRLLVLGGGWLGRAAAAAGRNEGLTVQTADRSEWPQLFDLSSDAARCDAFAAADVIINACGLLRGEEDELDASNHRLARAIAHAIARTGTQLVHLGSAAEYGPPATDLVAEDHPTHPGSCYGRSKLAGTTAVLAESGPASAIVARIFNPVGPGQPPHQPVAEWLSNARSANRAPLLIHNADTVRDFVSIHDVGRTLIRLASLDRPGPTVVNVCSGTPVRYGDLARALLRRLGSHRQVRSLGQPVTPLRVVGDPSRLAEMTGIRLQGGAEEMAELALTIR